MGFSEGSAGRGATRGVLANAGWLYVDQGLRAVLVLAAFSAMTRHLGPDQFGMLSYAIAFPALFLPLATLGLDYVVVRELVRRPAAQNAILSSAGALLVVAAITTFALGAVAATCLPTAHPAGRLIWVTLFSLLGQPFQVIDFYFQSRVAARYAVTARLGASVVVNGFRIWLAWQGASVEWFAGAFVLEAVVTGLGLIAAYRAAGARRIRLWADADLAEAKQLLVAAWPLMLGGMAMAFYLRLDQLLLSHLAGAAALGTYAAGFRLGDATQFVTYALINSYFPRLVMAYADGSEAFTVATEQFLCRITWLAIAVAVGVTITAPWITRGLLGARFSESTNVLVVIAWANVFAAQIGVRGKWFLLQGWQVYSLIFFGVGAVVHLAGVWLLVPRHGPIGAAVSFCFAQALMALLAPWTLGKTRLAARAAWRSFLPEKLWR